MIHVPCQAAGTSIPVPQLFMICCRPATPLMNRGRLGRSHGPRAVNGIQGSSEPIASSGCSLALAGREREREIERPAGGLASKRGQKGAARVANPSVMPETRRVESLGEIRTRSCWKRVLIGGDRREATVKARALCPGSLELFWSAPTDGENNDLYSFKF